MAPYVLELMIGTLQNKDSKTDIPKESAREGDIMQSNNLIYSEAFFRNPAKIILGLLLAKFLK